MQIVYEIGIRFYFFLIQIASLFSPKAKQWISGRKTMWKELPFLEGQHVSWFHCASLGEFDQALPVMKLWREKHPNTFILVTFFSPSGFCNYHKRKHDANFVTYIPLDTKKNAHRFVKRIRPSVAFFIKYEFWHNHILSLKEFNVDIYSISTALRSSQIYFRWYGSFFRNILRRFDCFFVQNESTFRLLKSIGIQNLIISGDTRFDRVIENKEMRLKNTIIENFINQSSSVFIAGSTWPKDEELLLELLHSSLFDRYIIAPHNIDSQHITSLEASLSTKHIRYSNYTENSSATILIIDNIGYLSSAYFYADIAYVGGGFSGNLHNILEPAVFGLPVIFGPHFSRFPEAQSFIEEGIGFSVDKPEELIARIKKIIVEQNDISQKSLHFVEKNRGASQKIINLLSKK